MRAEVTFNVEFHGRFQNFDKLFNHGEIKLNLTDLNAETISYSIIDTNVEQGRNFIVSVVVGFEIDKKCRLDNFGKVFSVAKGCNMSVVDTKVVSVVIC